MPATASLLPNEPPLHHALSIEDTETLVTRRPVPEDLDLMSC